MTLGLLSASNMSSASYCSGCGKSFTSSGYWSHLTQSQNPSCQAIFDEQLVAICSDSEDVPPGPTDTDEDYSDHRFGQTDDGIESAESDEEDEDQRAIDHELEMGWEPLRSSPSHDQCMGDDANWDDDEDLVMDDTSRRLSAEQRIHDSTARIICYSSVYPHSRAGAILSVRGQAVDDCYSSSLGSHHNPWAPFTSELDWKVAYWAKMRGPGSTAFSELLAINGVRELLSLKILADSH